MFVLNLHTGAAHIKCWKMANTFTGLKLKGELGRFGKTEICDVLGVYPMPDEKVSFNQFYLIFTSTHYFSSRCILHKAG